MLGSRAGFFPPAHSHRLPALPTSHTRLTPPPPPPQQLGGMGDYGSAQQQQQQQALPLPPPPPLPPPSGRVGPDGEPYNRKSKSLSLLCENFVLSFGQAEGSIISLDASAQALRVERRRIYDIVNVLESIKVMTKVQKNQYLWNGLDGLAASLNDLKAEAVRELEAVGTVGGEEAGAGLDERKEKSMSKLSQRFVQMFMLSKHAALGLDEAARALLGE